MLEVSHLRPQSGPVAASRRTSHGWRHAGAAVAPKEDRIEEAPVSDGPVIAIVDDDQSFRGALKTLLGSFAFQVRTFGSGEEFLQSSELGRVACLLLDLAMPGMSGLEVKQQLGASGLQIPTVFVTAHADGDVERHLLAAGAIAVLRKPVDQQMLLRLVQGVVGER